MSISNNCLYSCFIKSDVNQFTYIWTIDNFVERNHNLIKSTVFHAEDSSWSLIVAPIVKNITDGNEYLGAFVNRESGEKPLWAKYTFSLINLNSNEKTNEKTGHCFYQQTNARTQTNSNGNTSQRQRNNQWSPMDTIVLNPGQFEVLRFEFSPPVSHQNPRESIRSPIQLIQGKSSGIKSFILREYLFDTNNHLLQNNKITVCCDIRLYSINDPIEQLERFDVTLFENYSSLLKESKFSDVKLNVEGIDIMAHKSILSSRSPVFAAMFEHQMKESTENVVKIVDMSTEVANELLHFIYSGKVHNLKKVAKDLLAAADKYELPQLVEMCEEHLMANLTIDTAPQVLVLSHLHKALKLKTVVVEFIIANRKDVMKCDNWELIKQQPDLMEELFKALSNFCDKNAVVFCP